MRQLKLTTLTLAIAALTGCLQSGGGSAADATASRLTPTTPSITTSGTPTVSAVVPAAPALDVLDLSTYHGRFETVENANYHITFDLNTLTFSGLINGPCRVNNFAVFNCDQPFHGNIVSTASNDGYGAGIVSLHLVDTVNHSNYDMGGVPSYSNLTYPYTFQQVSANCFKAYQASWGVLGLIDVAITSGNNSFTFCRN